MQVGVLKTDGGPHSAEDWARVTASQIIDIAASAPTALIHEAREFETKLIALLTGFHDRVQKSERGALEKHGAARLATEISTDDHHADAVREVIDLAEGTSFENHFAKPAIRVYLARVLNDHFHTSMQIERSWHADRHPDNEHSKAFRAMFHGVSVVASNTPAKKEGK